MTHASPPQLDSESIFQSTFQNAFVGIAHVAQDGQWLRVNRTLMGLLGYSEKELLLLTFHDITHPDDLNKTRDLSSLPISGDWANYRMEKRYFRKNGAVVWVDLQVAAQFDSRGNFAYYIATILDVSESKHLIEQLRDQAGEVENLINLLGHELRTPLSVISAHANLIELIVRDEPLSQAVAKSVAGILSNVKASSDFLKYVDEMAAFQEKDAAMEVVDLGSVVRLAVKNSEVGINETGTLIVVPLALPSVIGQRVAIDRVLHNLLDNAIKYRRLDEPCTVTLTATSSEKKVVLQVSDTGRGVPAGQIDNVFNPTWRASNVGEASGRGLGLGFCARLMKTQGGSIDVRSVKGGGTSFMLTFRAAA